MDAEIGRPVPGKRIPAALTCAEVSYILVLMTGVTGLPAWLIDGTRLGLREAPAPCTEDVEFAHRVVILKEGKGRKDQVAMLAQSLEKLLDTPRISVGR